MPDQRIVIHPSEGHASREIAPYAPTKSREFREYAQPILILFYILSMNQIFVACSHIYLVVAMIPLIYVLVFGTMFFSRRFVFGLFLVHVFLIVKHRSIDYVRKMVKAYQGNQLAYRRRQYLDVKADG